jgi:hypothetical protein
VENKLVFDNPVSHSLPMKFRYLTSVGELSLKIPPTFIPDQKSGQDILDTVRKYIDELKKDGLLARDPEDRYNEPQNEQLYITASGRFFIRRHYQGLYLLLKISKNMNKLLTI